MPRKKLRKLNSKAKSIQFLEENNKKTMKKKRGNYTKIFTISGLIWGIVSESAPVVFWNLKLPRYLSGWLTNIIFLPAYLSAKLSILLLLFNPLFQGASTETFVLFLYFFTVIVTIFIGLFIGWLIGKTIDYLIIKTTDKANE